MAIGVVGAIERGPGAYNWRAELSEDRALSCLIVSRATESDAGDYREFACRSVSGRCYKRTDEGSGFSVEQKAATRAEKAASQPPIRRKVPRERGRRQV